MKYVYIACILLCGILGFIVASNASEQANVVVNMRNHGYTMGDLMPMRIEIQLPKNTTLDIDSLPFIGRLKPWIDVREIKVEETKGRAIIHLTWQIFATVEIAQTLKTPEIILKTLEKPAKNIIIPAQAFYYSPVFPPPPIKEVKRRENLIPPLLDEKTPFLGMVFCLTLLLLSAGVLVWLKDMIPWLPFKAGPLALLTQNLKLEIKKFGALDSFNLSQLREIHKALNETAGVSIYPNNLEVLFKNSPYLKHEENAISSFFHQSWAQFYPSNQATTLKIDLLETMRLLERCALAERLFRRQKLNFSQQ